MPSWPTCTAELNMRTTRYTSNNSSTFNIINNKDSHSSFPTTICIIPKLGRRSPWRRRPLPSRWSLLAAVPAAPESFRRATPQPPPIRPPSASLPSAVRRWEWCPRSPLSFPLFFNIITIWTSLPLSLACLTRTLITWLITPARQSPTYPLPHYLSLLLLLSILIRFPTPSISNNRIRPINTPRISTSNCNCCRLSAPNNLSSLPYKDWRWKSSLKECISRLTFETLLHERSHLIWICFFFSFPVNYGDDDILPKPSRALTTSLHATSFAAMAKENLKSCPPRKKKSRTKRNYIDCPSCVSWSSSSSKTSVYVNELFRDLFSLFGF